MGDTLFGRRARVTVSIPVDTPGDFTHVTTDEMVINGGDDPSAPGLRVKFKIDKTDQKDPNSSIVIITNLSPSSRARLQKKGVKLTLEAGYQATGVSRIFVGDVRTVDHVRNEADWDTTLKLGDGERAYRFARVAESFAAGTPKAVILQRLANLSGLVLGNVPNQAGALRGSFDQGYSATGRWSDVFDRFVKSLGLTWSIQDGALQVLAPGQAQQAQVLEISPSTGLVGSPEMGTPEKKGQPALLKFKFLLQPLLPGGQVKLVSARYNGFVRARKVSIEGDTRGSEWYTTVEGVIVA
jgi:hypothetical protein